MCENDNGVKKYHTHTNAHIHSLRQYLSTAASRELILSMPHELPHLFLSAIPTFQATKRRHTEV